MRVTVIPRVISALGTDPKGLERVLEELEIGTFAESTNNSIDKIGQNTKKSPGDLRRLAVTQTQMKDHQLTPVWKNLHNNYKKMRICCLVELTILAEHKVKIIGSKKKALARELKKKTVECEG